MKSNKTLYVLFVIIVILFIVFFSMIEGVNGQIICPTCNGYPTPVGPYPTRAPEDSCENHGIDMRFCRTHALYLPIFINDISALRGE